MAHFASHGGLERARLLAAAHGLPHVVTAGPDPHPAPLSQLAEAVGHLRRDSPSHVYLDLVAGSIVNCEVIRFVGICCDRSPVRCFCSGTAATLSFAANRAALAEHRPRLRVYRLPAYAPELTADEWQWAG